MATMTKLLIHIPVAMKQKLDGLRSQGYTVSGYLRNLIEDDMEARTEFEAKQQRRKGKGGTRHGN